MIPRLRGRSTLTLCLSAVLLAGVALPAAAEDFIPLGDGSAANNADLLRDPSTGCENCEPDPPHDFSAPWLDLDWNVALRGAFVHTSTGDYLEGSAIPSFTFRHETMRGGYEVIGSAEFDRSTIEGLRIGALRSAFKGDYRLDADTGIAGQLNLSRMQASANAPGTDPTILTQPVVLAGDGTVSLSRDVGPLVFTGTFSGSRTVYGATILTDLSSVDNSAQNNWTSAAALRIGYRVTPVLTAFVEGEAGYQWYDLPSPVYLVKLDAADYQLRTGLSARWHDILEGEVSVGYGLRRFADPMFGDVGALLYDANVTFRPDETVEMKAGFGTSFGAPGPMSGGSARLEYAATGEIGYRVNPWLKLRATAGARYARLLGTANTETGVNGGIGADYLLNEHTSLTADYVYAWGVATPNPAEDSHTVSVGVTFHK